MRVSNTAIGLFLIVFAGTVLVYVQTFPSLDNGYPGPALFPRVLAVLFLLAGIGLVFEGRRSGEKLLKFDLGPITRAGLINIGLMLAVILAYIYLSDLLGFMILTPLLLLIMAKWLGVKTHWSLVLAVGLTLVIYVLFAKILLVPLPWGLWGW
ncbi:MAG: tripartite tricarboxylate transporter TctB family protein [Desulfobacterales bacterium]|nr:MAG: tripartite tricarboxylate transporter TctB family protein [Desulfobacterales bacterium]